MTIEDSKKVHFTLKPSTNAVLPIIWGAVAFVLIWKAGPVAWFIPTIALVLGAIGGIMQNLSLKENPSEIATAASMLEIRNAMKVTKWGKRYLFFLWTSFAIYTGLSIWNGTNVPVNIFTSYFSFMCVREVVTFKATVELQRQINGRTNG